MDTRTIEAIRAALGATLGPPSMVVLPISGATTQVPTMAREYQVWGGDLGRFTSPSVPGKTVYDFLGRPLWAEVIIRSLLEAAGWDAVWVKNFGGGRKFWLDMDLPKELEPAARDVLASIDARIDGLLGMPPTTERDRLKRGGVWDVLAVRGNDVLFVEDKYAPGLNWNQKLFLEAALQMEGAPTFVILNRRELPAVIPE